MFEMRWVGSSILALLFLAPAGGGVLTFLQVHQLSGLPVDEQREQPGESTPVDRPLALSADSRHLYIGGYARGTLLVMGRDATEESLTLVDMVHDGVRGATNVDGASGIAVSPDGNWVYVTSRTRNTLTLYSRDPSSGRLSIFLPFEHKFSGILDLEGPSSVAVSPEGRQVYVTARESNALAVFSRDASRDTFGYRGVEKDGRDGVDGLGGASSVAVSPDGSRVYATGAAENALVVFARDASIDALTFLEVHKEAVRDVVGLEAASDVAVSADHKHVYVTGEAKGTLSVFRRDPESGRLVFLKVYRDGVEGVDGLAGARSVTLSPDGNLVLVAGQKDSAIAVFRRNLETGELRFEEVRREGAGGITGLTGLSKIVVSSDGKHLYAAGEKTVSSFRLASGSDSPSESKKP